MLRTITVLIFFLGIQPCFPQPSKLQLLPDSLRVAGGFPGLSVAIVGKENTAIALVSGFNDIEKTNCSQALIDCCKECRQEVCIGYCFAISQKRKN